MAANDTIECQLNQQKLGIEKVEKFKYLGSAVQDNEKCNCDFKRLAQARWHGWRRAAGSIFHKKIQPYKKEKLHKMLVIPGMDYGLETVAFT